MHPLRTMFSSIIYVSNVRRPILCSSALLIGDLYVSPKYYTINTIHISKTSSTSDEYCSSYNSFPSFFHQKWRPSWIYWFFRNYFLPMSLSSSLRSFYRKPHQNRTSSSRVIEEHTHKHTYRHTKNGGHLGFFGYSRNYFLPMSLSSSMRSIYRKPHQNRTSSSRVIEEQTHKHTDILYPFINSRD